jgi:hypothetical protein
VRRIHTCLTDDKEFSLNIQGILELLKCTHVSSEKIKNITAANYSSCNRKQAI